MTSVNAATFNFDSGIEVKLAGDAYLNSNHVPNGVVLTKNQNSKMGSAFTTTTFTNISNFSATFDFAMGWDSVRGQDGADGLTFAWVSNPESAPTSGGGDLGYSGLNGYSIEFDTYKNSWDINGNHVAVNGSSVRNSLTQTSVNDFNLSNERYHHAEVTFNNGLVSLAIDGKSYIDNYMINNYQAFDGSFGFTAATGGLNDYHKIKNFELTVSAVPEASSIAMMLGGLGLVGFMAARRKKQA